MLRFLGSSVASAQLGRAGVLCLVVAACSPTYQSVYEGDVRFEHCYRVDEERSVPIADKLQCWREWSRRYHYRQSHDRIGYALARQRTLAQALAAGEQAAPRGATEAAPRTLPQPTNAFAPPPQTMDPATTDGGAHSSGGNRGDAGTSEPATGIDLGPALTLAPGAGCVAGCGKSWVTCNQQCKGAACRAGCDERYRSCMRACF